MTRFPDDVKYSMQHLWLRLSDGREARIGGTDWWLGSLGSLVHLDLPQAGQEVQAGDRLGEITGPASSEPIIAPIPGVVSAVNQRVLDDPELARTDPWGDGWLCEIELAADAHTDQMGLVDAAAYEALVSNG